MTRTASDPARTRIGRLAGRAKVCPRRTGSLPKSPSMDPAPDTTIAIEKRPSLTSGRLAAVARRVEQDPGLGLAERGTKVPPGPGAGRVRVQRHLAGRRQQLDQDAGDGPVAPGEPSDRGRRAASRSRASRPVIGWVIAGLPYSSAFTMKPPSASSVAQVT